MRVIAVCRYLGAAPMLSFFAACGATVVIETHPALAPAGEAGAARVYFMRPNIGYPGVMGKAFSISWNDKELLTLAKGDYALVYLRPDSGKMTIQSWTVINGGMGKITETRSFSFDAGRTYYVAFSVNYHLISYGTSYVPTLIMGDAVTEAASKTKPIGRAAQEPISSTQASPPRTPF
jgi:hypothetical protein